MTPGQARNKLRFFPHELAVEMSRMRSSTPLDAVKVRGEGVETPDSFPGRGVLFVSGESWQIRQIQTWIDRMQAGDTTARGELIGFAADRLHRLTRKMLKGYPRVKRWELTDDVMQNAVLRLWKALAKVTPSSARHFFALATVQIRRELIDLSRRYYGPEGMAAKHESHVQGDNSASMPEAGKADSKLDPRRLAERAEVHERVDSLPVEEREVIDLLYYQGLTQAEAAAVLDISEATLKRRRLAALRRLDEMLKGNLPDS